MKYPAHIVRDIFIEQGYSRANDATAFWMADADYHPITEDDVLAIWDEAFKRLDRRLKVWRQAWPGGPNRLLPVWSAGGGDCDNHAMWIAGMLSQASMLTTVLKPGTGGRIFGPMWYTAERKPINSRDGGHSAMLAITPNETVLCFEPADRRFVPLTESERRSVRFAYFY